MHSPLATVGISGELHLLGGQVKQELEAMLYASDKLGETDKPVRANQPREVEPVVLALRQAG